MPKLASAASKSGCVTPRGFYRTLAIRTPAERDQLVRKIWRHRCSPRASVSWASSDPRDRDLIEGRASFTTPESGKPAITSVPGGDIRLERVAETTQECAEPVREQPEGPGLCGALDVAYPAGCIRERSAAVQDTGMEIDEDERASLSGEPPDDE